MGEGERRPRSGDAGPWPRRRIVALLVTCAGVGAAVLHVLAPDLRIDGIVVMLLAIAAVPWLGELFRSIEVPGFARIEFQDIERRIDDVQRTANAALAGDGDGPDDDGAAWDTVRKLAAEYVNVRLQEVGSAARTQRMDRIFARLVRAAQRVPDFDVEGLLASQDAGLRLAAYARLYALPEQEALGPLVDAAIADPLAFNQYWGLRAVESCVADRGAAHVPLGAVRRLREFRASTPADNDRGKVADRILAETGER
ncbi:hypothetical protein [Streptomyces sp. SCL15-4]|uniref:hypothetical protein n=1 Tax=Streptomyces sp. SCL15-4 TaxID=2967221 RepID=UPI0029671887|nr:hypothetical protein [Streptomyces sp. SCL15-4]